ncbi:hypothetical protein [Actinokineospora pegani]|uniref:hypothetical protein n=1 Tax=Actinokineospora pegani TaxID=2654637 RepID=UPI001F1BB4A0|nr:hypothetical protein [Actinokineospora pegani]
MPGTPFPVDGGGSRGLVGQYFTDLNDTADEGTAAQREFLRRTQHPDFTDRACDLGDLTLRIDPALTTLRVDPEWRPEGASSRPRGEVFVVAVTVRIRRDGATIAQQIGSQRVIVLAGKAYGFTPCPTR